MLKRFKIIIPIIFVLCILTSLLVMVTPVSADSVDLYWVGGSGDWASTSHWSTSNGGAGGHAIPTSTNNVFFDTGSGLTSGSHAITCASNLAMTTKNLDFTNVSYPPTIDHHGTASGAVLQIYGDLTMVTGVVYNQSRFASSSKGVKFMAAGTIIMGGGTFGSGCDTIDICPGIGSTVSLGDNFNVGSNDLYLYNGGTFDTNGYTVTTTSSFVCNTGTSNYLTLDASTFNCGETWQASNLTTLNAGTSTINYTGSSFTANASTTYYDVNFTGPSINLTGANSFHNLSMTGTTTTSYLQTSGDITVSDTFTATGASVNQRLFVQSNNTTPRTITAATVTSSYTDYKYITAAGAGDWDLSGATEDSIGYSGTTGITCAYPYDANDDLYWFSGTGTYSDEYKWSTASGGYGSGGSRRHAVPTSTNNVIFDTNSSASTYTVTLTSDADCADMTIANPSSGIPVMTQSAGVELYIYGSLTNTSSLTAFDSISIYFKATSTGKTITTNGATMTQAVFSGVGGGWTLQDSLTTTTTNSGLSITNGTLNTNDKTVTLAGEFYANPGSLGIILGSSVINCTAWHIYSGTLTFNAGTSTINITPIDTDDIFDGNSLTYYDVNYTTSYISGNTTFQDSNTFHNLTINGGNIVDLVVDLDSNQTVTGTFTATGYSSSRRLNIFSDTLHTARTITAATIGTNSNVLFRDITGAGAGNWNLSAQTGIGDCGGNTGITFPAGINVYAVEGIGNYSFSNPVKWASTSGGTAGSERVPLPQDIAVFDTNSMTIPGVTVTFDTSDISGIDSTLVTNSPTFYKTSSLYTYNSVDLGTCTWSVSGTIYMYGQTSQSLGGDFGGSSLFIDVQGGSISQSSDLIAGNSGVNYISFRSGIWITNDYAVTCSRFSSNTTTYSRSLWMGASVFTTTCSTSGQSFWNVDGTNLSINSGTSTIIITTASVVSNTFYGGGETYYNLKIQGAGAYTVTFNDANTFNDIIIYRSNYPSSPLAAAAKTITGNYKQTVQHLYSPLYGTTMTTIGTTDFSKSTGLVALDYLAFSGGNNTSVASGGATFLAGTHSTGSPQTGWSFTDSVSPVVSAAAATGVNRTYATLNGSIDSLGSYTAEGVYIYFIYDTVTISSLTQLTATTTTPILYTTIGTKSETINPPLTVNTTYHYRVICLYNGGDTVYSDDTTFLTLGAPLVATQAVSAIEDTTATFNGSLLDLGDYTSAFGFFLVGTSTGNYDLGGTFPETALTSVSTFTYAMTDLDIGGTYYVKAAVRYNATQYAYGSEVSFTTVEAPYIGGGGSTSILGDSPLMPPQMYTELDTSKVPGGDAVDEILNDAGLTSDASKGLWWFPFIFGIIGILSLLVYGLTVKTGGQGSELLMVVVIEAGLVFFGILGVTNTSSLIPLWPMLLFPLPAIALILSKKHYGWG